VVNRRIMRAPVKLKIKFRSANLAQFIERYAVDVSKGGIFIRTKDPLEVGTKLKFEFQLQDGSPLIVGEGTVVWIREHDPNRKGIAPGMGVRFDKLQPESQKVLAEILTRKAGAVLSSPEGEAEAPGEIDPATESAEPAAAEAPAPERPIPEPAVAPSPASPGDAVPVAGGLHDLETSRLESPPPEKAAPPPQPAPEPEKPAPKPAPEPEKPAPSPAPEPEKPAPSPDPEPEKPAPKPAPEPEKPAPRPAPEKPRPAATSAPIAASAPAAAEPGKSKAGLIAIVVLAIIAIGLVGLLVYRSSGKDDKKKDGVPTAQRTEPDAAAELPMDPPPAVDAAAPKPVQPDAAAPPACEGTLVDVASEPAGAKIFLDDKDTGGVTPGQICVTEAKKKSYLRLELKNHKPGEFYFTKDQKVDTLKLEPVVYRVVIQTEPRGAEVHLDGNRIGYTTMPYSLPWDKDVVVLKLIRRGYEAQEITIDRAKITWQAKGKYYFQGTIAVFNLKATGAPVEDMREAPPPDMREAPPPDMREAPPPDMREAPPPDMREAPPPDMREAPPPDMREAPPPDMRVEPMRPADDGMDPGWLKPQ
jgi:uncharacterized protein (TIGR02266 family)